MVPCLVNQKGKEIPSFTLKHALTSYRHILTGSYDSVIRIYDHSQNLLRSIGGHTGPVTSVCWASPSSEKSRAVVSGSHDGTARITLVPDLEPQNSSQPLYSAASLRLHTSPLSSVAVNESGSHILTAGWDGLLGLFSTAIPQEDEVMDEDEVVSRKKRRRIDSTIPQPKRKVRTFQQLGRRLTDTDRRHCTY